MVELVPLDDDDREWLRSTLARHRELTGSDVADRLLGQWGSEVGSFLKVMPEDVRRVLNVMREAEAEGQRPFDLQAGPLLRVLLLQLEDEEQVLVVTMHHIVSDGWSMGIFIHEFVSLYGAYRSGEESPLAELPLQYADFAVWQRGWLQGAVLEQQLEYWRKQLGGRLPVLELPGDRPRPAVRSYGGANYSFRLSGELSAGLRAREFRACHRAR